MRLAMEIHRARRFYERPESKREYQRAPDSGGDRCQRLPRPGARLPRALLAGRRPPGAAAHGSGSSSTSRWTTPPRLATSQWLSARDRAGRATTTACRTTRTRCQAVGDDLVTVPRTEDWADERAPARRRRVASRVLDMDPDGTALKLDRYLWTLPRLLAIEQNGDPVHAAPTALRSLGFTVVRHKKALETQDRIEPPERHSCQPVDGGRPAAAQHRGRHPRACASRCGTTRPRVVHAARRRIDVEVVEHGKVSTTLPEEGFIQGTAATETPDVDDSPVHVHEAMFGWEGWSLRRRATRQARPPRGRRRDRRGPGRRPRPGDATRSSPPRSSRHAAAAALRALVRVPGVGGRPGRQQPRPRASARRPRPLRPRSPRSRRRWRTSPRHASRASSLNPTLRSETAAGIVRRRFTVPSRSPKRCRCCRRCRCRRSPESSALVLEPAPRRAAPRRSAYAPRAASADRRRASLVARAFGDAVVDDDAAVHRRHRAPRSRTLPRSRDFVPERRGGIEPLDSALDVVTPLRPFLRWDPVPAAGDRVRDSASRAGESLRQLVVRSGVTQDLDTLEITVDAARRPTRPRIRASATAATSERHLAPPKTSQSEAELHGTFDEAIGSTDPADHQKLLGGRPARGRHPVRRRRPAARRPGQSAIRSRGSTSSHDPDGAGVELKTLPLPTGEAPAPGQYVVHDTDELVLPYLPDSSARGISLVFPEAGRDRTIAVPVRHRGLHRALPRRLARVGPFRLVLDGVRGARRASSTSTCCTSRFPPATSSASASPRRSTAPTSTCSGRGAACRRSIRRTRRRRGGGRRLALGAHPVRGGHARARRAPPARGAAADRRWSRSARRGRHRRRTCVGAVDVHGPSTEPLTAEASWTDPDRRPQPRRLPDERATQAMAFTTPIRASEDLAVLSAAHGSSRSRCPASGPVWLHSRDPRLGDTRHHTIDYRFRASTRFREYFDPETLRPPPAARSRRRRSTTARASSGPRSRSPCRARRGRPRRSCTRCCRCSAGRRAPSPSSRSRPRARRRAGVRIYLERPWFSSGEGELLGVLLAPGGDDSRRGSGIPSASGAPIPSGSARPSAPRAMLLQLDNLLRVFGLDDRPGDARPGRPPATLPLGRGAGRAGCDRARLPPAVQPGPRALVRRRGDRSREHVLAVRAPRRRPLPAGQHRRLPPVGAGAVRLRPAHAGAHHERQPHRRPPRARRGQRPGRSPGAATGPRRVDRGRADRASTTTPRGSACTARWSRGCSGATRRSRPTSAGRRSPTDGAARSAASAATSSRPPGSASSRRPRTCRCARPGENADWRVTVEEWERLPGDPADLADPTFAARLGAATDLRRRDPALSDRVPRVRG